jgi:hypothetical protein
MYDGINSLAAGIRARFPDAAMVGCYIDGHFAWTAEQRDLFPHAVRVAIAVHSSTNAGDVIDCETGDATPAQAAQWVRMRHAAGYCRPTVYCSRSVIPAVRKATGNLLLTRDYDIWCADYTGSAHLVAAPGTPAAACAATQWASTSGWDVSAVYDDGWPHRAGPQAPPPAGWHFYPVRGLAVAGAGPSSVKLTWQSPDGPPGAAAVGRYQVTIRQGGRDLPTYPRYAAKTAVTETVQFGSLPRGSHLDAMVRAMEHDGSHAGTWAVTAFTTTTG